MCYLCVWYIIHIVYVCCACEDRGSVKKKLPSKTGKSAACRGSRRPKGRDSVGMLRAAAYAYIHTYIHTKNHTHTYIYIWCVCGFMYVCMYVCMCVCIMHKAKGRRTKNVGWPIGWECQVRQKCLLVRRRSYVSGFLFFFLVFYFSFSFSFLFLFLFFSVFYFLGF